MYRPLSPHLLIYKPQWSSICSVAHRATGILLAAVLMLSAACLKFLVLHATHYPIYYIGCSLSTYLAWIVVGTLVMLTYGLFYHLSNGIRHLIWDVVPLNGALLEKDKLDKSAYAVVLSAAILGSAAMSQFWLLLL